MYQKTDHKDDKAELPGVVSNLHQLEYARKFPMCWRPRSSRLTTAMYGVTLDFGHLHLSTKFYNLDMLNEVRSVVPFIAHCHVHDNFGHSAYATEKIQTHQIPFGKGDSHMPVGWGNIPFSSLLAEFIHDYDGLLICELRSRYFDQTGEAAKNLALLLQSFGI